MTRIFLLTLAVVETLLGTYGLVGVANLLLDHAAGMATVFLPILAMVALLLVAGAAIFIRRPWSYYLHVVLIPLLGLLFVVYLGPLLGTGAPITVLLVGTVVVPLTVAFLLAPVRAFFGVS